MPERVLVTGVLGCLGAWVARCVLDDGDAVVGYDLGDARHRLELVLGDDAATDRARQGRHHRAGGARARASTSTRSRASIHLAALQVPFVRANPPLGMHVNVAGTVNVFEAVSRRLDRIPNVVYASSTAVYTADDPSPAPESGGTRPGTLYGVSKLADEGMARVYHAELGVPSIGLRPYVVYGPGRDQGMTSGPTVAMLAAARGEPCHIGYSGTAQYDYAPDVARALVMAAHSGSDDGASVYNVPGAIAPMAEVVARIQAVVPERGDHLRRRAAAVPARARGGRLRPRRRAFPRTPWPRVAATIAHFRAPPAERRWSGVRSADAEVVELPRGYAGDVVRVRLAYGEDGLEVELPDDRSTVIVPLHQEPAPDATAEVVRALRQPLAGKPLRALVQHGQTVAISICDGTRAQPRHVVVPAILDELDGHRRPRRRRDPRRHGHAPGQHARGAARDARRRGRRLDPDRQPRRAGRRLADVWVGRLGADVPVWLNREWLEADVRITTGFVEPHFFAGFSGGPKMVAPGLAGLETVLTLHDASRIGHPDARWGVLDGQPRARRRSRDRRRDRNATSRST